MSFAIPELIHLLGFGISRSFDTHVGTLHRFIGPEAVSVGSSTNPSLTLDEVDAHWKSGTKGVWNGITQEALLAPGIFPGRRTYMSSLDRAALRDIGWEEAEPGDANLDRAFDSSDLLAVFQVGKYETGVFAGWSEGDWNDNALFESDDLIAALQTGSYELAAAMSVTAPASNTVAGVVIAYNAETGTVQISSPADLLTAFEIQSASHALQTGSSPLVGGLFDVDRADKLFVLNTGGFESLTLSGLLPTGWNLAQLSSDLSFEGALLGGGALPGVAIQVVPEPTGIMLAFAAAPVLWRFARKR